MYSLTSNYCHTIDWGSMIPLCNTLLETRNSQPFYVTFKLSLLLAWGPEGTTMIGI